MKKKILLILMLLLLLAVILVIWWSRTPAKAKIIKAEPTRTSEMVEKTEEMGKIFRWKYTMDWEIRVETNTDELAVVKLLEKKLGGDKYTLVVKSAKGPIEDDTGYVLRVRRGDEEQEVQWDTGNGKLFTSEDRLERVLFGSLNGYNYTLAQITSSNDDKEQEEMRLIVKGIKIGSGP